MSTRPGEHQGLGLTHYLWASSPLRRYCDLVNQRQLLAVVAGERPPYADNDAELFAALADFEATYWPVRRVPGPDGALLVPALAAAGARDRDRATVIRDNVVRFEPAARRAVGRPRELAAGHAGARGDRRDRPLERDARVPRGARRSHAA